jgi:hypothetical protein
MCSPGVEVIAPPGGFANASNRVRIAAGAVVKATTLGRLLAVQITRFGSSS